MTILTHGLQGHTLSIFVEYMPRNGVAYVQLPKISLKFSNVCTNLHSTSADRGWVLQLF